ncbi:MAG: peptidase S41 [Parcubacteria group bacterium]|nr:peptidase S41 [Parcubacteria group bacterium]|tara:strand:+ start:28950 stop:30164 length:1215 start_codon:yes stop_codon:yes gene_type:complete
MTTLGKKSFLLFFLVVAILATFAFGYYIGQRQKELAPIKGVINTDLGEQEGVDFSLFWDVWRIVQEKHVDRGNLDFQEMVYGAISGMVKALDDPYTVFMPPADTKIFKEDVTGEFQGVGMEIGIRNGELTVVSPLEGTPAERAGLRAGDKILKVDDTFTRDLTIDEAVKLIRGPKGEEVVLTVLRDSWEKTKEIKIIRDVIEIPSLKWEMKGEDIAYIKLYQFSEKAKTDFDIAGIEILNSQAKKIILDLRGNPGGYLEVARDIAGWFLETGQIVTIEDFGHDIKSEEYKATGNEKFLSYPVVVLINQGSASGSEILAGALRDNRGIKLIGETSFGKGSVQQLEDLKENSSLKVTIAKWLTPNGDLIAGQGLEPDIKVEMTEEDYNEERDPQLDKAIETLNQIR